MVAHATATATTATPRMVWYGPLLGVFVIVAVVLPSISSFVVSVPPYRGGGGGIIDTTQQRVLFPQRHQQSPPPPQVSLAAKNKWENFDDFCAEQESKAIAASESWVVEATGFLEPPKSAALRDALGGRADVACLSVGSYTQTQQPEGGRVRCVYANPDLGYDEPTAESDYVSYLKIDNVALGQCDPWPNMLVNIGLSLDTVGDILLVRNLSLVYLAVAPESEKSCVRLLPKELPGNGVTVTKLSKDDLDTEMAAIGDGDGDGEVVSDMEVQRVDRRK